MRFCVVKAGVPRKKFIHCFPGNETNMEWIKAFKKENPKQDEALLAMAKEIKRA